MKIVKIWQRKLQFFCFTLSENLLNNIVQPEIIFDRDFFQKLT
jgi:hypothetical protein